MAARLTGPSMLALVADLTGPSLWRCLQPIAALEAAGYPCGWDFIRNRAAQRLVPHYDGTLLARSSWHRAARRLVEAALLEAHDAGRFLAMDLDDDILSSDSTRHLLAAGLADGKSVDEVEAGRYERIWAVSRVDGVTVTTPQLAALVASYTRAPVVVVPNAIDLPWFRAATARHTRQLPSPTIGWAGGARPDDDVAELAVAWRRIAKRYPAVRFVLVGMPPPPLVEAVPADRLATVPWLPLDRYPEPLGEIDIACCAVAATRFNACKTPIKAWEAAAAGSAVVASSWLYGETIEHGTTGYLADTADDWETALADLIDRPAARAMLATRLRRRVERQWSLRTGLHRWPEAWAAIQTATRDRHRRLTEARR